MTLPKALFRTVNAVVAIVAFTVSAQSSPQNTTQSVFELLKLAEQGDAAAQYVLGKAYVLGDGVTQDDDALSPRALIRVLRVRFKELLPQNRGDDLKNRFTENRFPVAI